MALFPTPRQDKSPTPMPTVDPVTVVPHIKPFCAYNGVLYSQGQKWQDGCNSICLCVNAETGFYRCNERCPSYQNVNPSCTLVMDPDDPCCQVPICVFLPVIPTPSIPEIPNHWPALTNTVSPVQGPSFPTPLSGREQRSTETAFTPVSITTVPPFKNVCVMDGLLYSTGQMWYDGCDKICLCEDGNTGYYKCTERCPQYVSLPKECILMPDPNDPLCCQIPQCVQPGQNVNPFPTTEITENPQFYTNVSNATTEESETELPLTSSPDDSPTSASGPIGAPTPVPRHYLFIIPVILIILGLCILAWHLRRKKLNRVQPVCKPDEENTQRSHSPSILA